MLRDAEDGSLACELTGEVLRDYLIRTFAYFELKISGSCQIGLKAQVSSTVTNKRPAPSE